MTEGGGLNVLLEANDRAHQGVLERLTRAMESIRSDMATRTNADGSPVRISAAEICRRAGVHAKTLNNRNHRETTRRMVREFLKEINSKSASSKRTPRRRVDEKNRIIADWEASYRNMAHHYDLCVLERDRLARRILELEEQNKKLVSSNREIENGLGNVLPLHRSNK